MKYKIYNFLLVISFYWLLVFTGLLSFVFFICFFSGYIVNSKKQKNLNT